MRWKSKSAIQNAAQRGLKAALKSSIQHWKQLHDATLPELLSGIISGEVTLDGNYCSLCEKFIPPPAESILDGCVHGCPLNDGLGRYGCAEEYVDASGAYDTLLNDIGRVIDHMKGNFEHSPVKRCDLEMSWDQWKHTSYLMVKRLEKEYEMRYVTDRLSI